MSLTSTSKFQLMSWQNALSIFFASVLTFVPVLSVKDYHPEWAGFNCTSNVGKGTVPHLVTGVLETEDSLICCHPTTCAGGTIKFCTQDNGTDICIPCPRNGNCNYNNVTSEHLFTMIDFCTELCTRKNAVPDVVFYPSSQTKKAGDDVTFTPTVHSDSELTGFIWRFINTTGSYEIANSLAGISNRRKYKVGTLQNPYLSITNIEPQDHGTYQLLVANLIGLSHVKDVVLNVTAQPIVSMSKVSDNVDAGSTYVISCTITGNLKAIKSTFFFKNIHGKVTEINSTVYPSGLMTHTIHNTSSSDSGEYTCKAENSEGRAESTLHLTVDIPPEMYSPFAGHVMEYMIGDNVSISVWVSMTPNVFDLRCENEDCPSKKMLRSMPYNVSNVGMSFNYTIVNVQPDAKGTYVCIAINSLGARNFSVAINVKSQSTTTAPLVTPKEQDCEWLYNLTTNLAIIVLVIGLLDLIRIRRCSGNKLTKCEEIILLIVFAAMIVSAIAVLISINIAEKDCSKDTMMMEAIFCVFLFLSAVFEICCFCKVSYIFQNKTKYSNQQDVQIRLQSHVQVTTDSTP